MGWLINLLNPLNAITSALTDAYKRKLEADTDKTRIAADVEISNLEAKRDVVMQATISDRWWSPRNIMGLSVAAYVGKIIVWDSVLQLGVTPYPGEQVTFIVMTVIGFYFVSKGAETVANTIAGALAKRNR